MPTILIADDNAVSLHFLAEAVRTSGCDAETAADGAQALLLATRRHFDLLLLDLCMPELGGEAVVQRLRQDANAASHDAIAVATSADLVPARVLALRAAGFADAIAKPVALDALRELLRRHLGDVPRPHAVVHPDAPGRKPHEEPATASLPLLDEAAALAATGDAAVMSALRSLFARELDELPGELQRLRLHDDAAGLRDRLHRLRASCGFCGAPALDAAAVALQHPDGAMPSESSVAALLEVAARTRALLPPRDD